MEIEDLQTVFDDSGMTPAQKLVLIAVAVSGTVTLKDISDMTGYSVRHTQRVLSGLADNGMIRYKEASFEYVD